MIYANASKVIETIEKLNKKFSNVAELIDDPEQKFLNKDPLNGKQQPLKGMLLEYTAFLALKDECQAWLVGEEIEDLIKEQILENLEALHENLNSECFTEYEYEEAQQVLRHLKTVLTEYNTMPRHEELREAIQKLADEFIPKEETPQNSSIEARALAIH